jgi:hypothetical protein
MWAPGAEPTTPSEVRSLWALLEWLARYPTQIGDTGTAPPPTSDAIAVTASANADIDDALETTKQRGGLARAWVVGDAEIEADVPVQRAGLKWPL